MKFAKLTKRFIQDYPLEAFFLVAFAIAWLGSFLMGGLRFFRGEDIEFLDIIIMGLTQLVAPILSGVLISFIVDGKSGIDDMFRRMKIWRLGKWCLIVLIFPVLILIVSLLLSATISSEFSPVFLIGMIMMGILSGFIEEVGWMGFAFPRMRSKHGLIRTSLYLGLIHGLWHLPLWFFMQYSALGGYWYPYFIAFVAFLVALRVIIVWAYSRTNSLLLSQMIHASSTGFLAVLTRDYIEPTHWAIFYSVYAVFLWVVALVVIREMADSSRRG